MHIPQMGHVIDLYEVIMVVAYLFSVPFLIIPTMDFVLFRTVHRIDIFIELAIMSLSLDSHS